MESNKPATIALTKLNFLEVFNNIFREGKVSKILSEGRGLKIRGESKQFSGGVMDKFPNLFTYSEEGVPMYGSFCICIRNDLIFPEKFRFNHINI